jgi:small subunit ribosomal protein S2
MRNVTLEELLEAGCHFGHQVTRGNPKSRDFVFEARDGIHIIDLAKTKEGLEEAGKFIKTLATNPNINLVIVGTKRQTQEVLTKELARVRGEINGEQGLYDVRNRWIGGLLTNFSEVSKNFKKLTDLNYKLENKSEQTGFTKKEIGGWSKEKEKLERLYGGVYKLTKVPDVLFIIDSHLENLAVIEASKMNIPTVAITDTNSDPHLVDYPIPANDDAVGSLELIIGYILDAWREGRNSAKIEKVAEEKKPEPKKAKTGISPQEALADEMKKEAAKKSSDTKNVAASVKIEGNKPLKKPEPKKSEEKETKK